MCVCVCVWGGGGVRVLIVNFSCTRNCKTDSYWRSPSEGHREVAITKKLIKVPPESPGNNLFYGELELN